MNKKIIKKVIYLIPIVIVIYLVVYLDYNFTKDNSEVTKCYLPIKEYTIDDYNSIFALKHEVVSLSEKENDFIIRVQDSYGNALSEKDVKELSPITKFVSTVKEKTVTFTIMNKD